MFSLVSMEKLIEEFKKFVDFVRANESHDQRTRDYSNRIYQQIVDLENKLSFDELTGLFGRIQFEKILEKEAALTERTGRGFAFLILDLVGLKHINDTHSRSVGDDFIKFAAKWLKDNTRESDIIGVGRFGEGADEFGVIARSDKLNLDMLIKRLKDKLEGVKFNNLIPLQFSIGGAIFSKGDDLKNILELAEKKLNKDKEKLKAEGHKVRS